MTQDGTRLGNASGTDKQRPRGRLSQEIPILLIGRDAEGTVFSEGTKTVVLSQHRRSLCEGGLRTCGR
jgi:hypothetical protein